MKKFYVDTSDETVRKLLSVAIEMLGFETRSGRLGVYRYARFGWSKDDPFNVLQGDTGNYSDATLVTVGRAIELMIEHKDKYQYTRVQVGGRDIDIYPGDKIVVGCITLRKGDVETIIKAWRRE